MTNTGERTPDTYAPPAQRAATTVRGGGTRWATARRSTVATNDAGTAPSAATALAAWVRCSVHIRRATRTAAIATQVPRISGQALGAKWT